jgi:hypothetical protein
VVEKYLEDLLLIPTKRDYYRHRLDWSREVFDRAVGILNDGGDIEAVKRAFGTEEWARPEGA